MALGVVEHAERGEKGSNKVGSDSLEDRGLYERWLFRRITGWGGIVFAHQHGRDI